MKIWMQAMTQDLLAKQDESECRIFLFQCTVQSAAVFEVVCPGGLMSKLKSLW
jgi:hypothetical protein